MQNEIKERDKIINQYAKIINRTKKEYQRLYAENIKYREKIKRQQQLDKNMRKKESRMYETQKQRNIQFTRRPRETETKKSCYYSESESKPQDYYN